MFRVELDPSDYYTSFSNRACSSSLSLTYSHARASAVQPVQEPNAVKKRLAHYSARPSLYELLLLEQRSGPFGFSQSCCLLTTLNP